MPTTLRLHHGDDVRTTEEAADVGALLGAGMAQVAARLGDAAERLELDDGTTRVEIQRIAGHRAEVRVVWADGEAAETVPLPGAAPVTDLAAALCDPERRLVFRGGLWFDGGAGEFVVPALPPRQLGNATFRSAHALRGNLVAGAMAGGIASPALVNAMGHAGLLGYFGAGGLPLDAVAAGLAALDTSVPVGANLLHNPLEPEVEEKTVDLFLERGIHEVDASAYMGLTEAVVRYRLHGIHEVGGRVVVPNRLAAKISRPEVAEPFLRPAPARILDALVAKGALTARQAELARTVPVAADITAEADSGGHTDRRPLVVLIPVIRRLVDRVAREEGYAEVPRVGAAGGLGDPWSVAAALQLGADYLMTGSVNQATLEAGTSPLVKEMLAQAGYADVASGPAPDMFEIGAEVQVLGRGTMYAQRAGRLYEIYKSYGSLEEIPAADRKKIETQIFARPLDDVWAETLAYWTARDPKQVAQAHENPRHKMALVFRWYLGMTSRWARTGEAGRKRDFQIWCGAAMGLFNDWVRGSALEPLAARSVVAVSEALLRGAAVATRVQMAQQVAPVRVDVRPG